MYQMKLNKPRILDLVIENRGVSHGICNFICMYIDAVAKMLRTGDMTFITIFKNQHKLYVV